MKVYAAAAAIAAFVTLAAAKPAEVTDKVYLDITIDGVDKGKIVIGLFGKYVLWFQLSSSSCALENYRWNDVVSSCLTSLYHLLDYICVVRTFVSITG